MKAQDKIKNGTNVIQLNKQRRLYSINAGIARLIFLCEFLRTSSSSKLRADYLLVLKYSPKIYNIYHKLN